MKIVINKNISADLTRRTADLARIADPGVLGHIEECLYDDYYEDHRSFQEHAEAVLGHKPSFSLEDAIEFYEGPDRLK